MWQQRFVFLCVLSLMCATTGSALPKDIWVQSPLTDQGKVQAVYISCPYPWVWVERSCVFVDKFKQRSWQDARDFCKELHKNGDLTTAEDANEFADLLRYIRTIVDGNYSFWIGGRDVSRHNEWKWITGESMTMGSPFWGQLGTVNEPTSNNEEYCAFLSIGDRHLIHDRACDAQYYAFCQFRPQNPLPL